MSDRGVGRGRGGPPALQGAWGQRQAATSSIGRSVRAPTPIQAPLPPQHCGEGGALPPLPVVGQMGPGGDAGGPAGGGAGRGTMRGRMVVHPDILNTRPESNTNKNGNIGERIQLLANYFKITTKPDWCLYQYRVDFAPEEDRTIVKKGLLRLHRETLGSYIFDGTVMYTANRLIPPNGPDMELFGQRRSDGENIRITIRLVGDMVKGDPHYLQFYNIMARRSLEHLQLQLVGRNYFDPAAKVMVAEHKFELWPGYITSIRQHEKDILMCAEINHKVMRQETLLDILGRMRGEAGAVNYQNAYKNEVIGLTVLTDYNNNTYRIDDVDFGASPKSTFHLRREDRDVSYQDYYRVKYNIIIRNGSQPMLVSRSSARDRRAGVAEVVYLVPELCRATGLTDTMRNDFRLMIAMGQHTRVTPDRRIDMLLAFNRRLNSEPLVQDEFRNWNLVLDRDLVRVPGRRLPEEKVFFGADKVVTSGSDGDWTRAIKDSQLLVSNQLNSWVVIVPSRISRDARGFCDGMRRSIRNFRAGEPHFIEINNDRSESYTTALEQVLSKNRPQLVMCILMRNRADTYAAIKKKCCIDRAVPSQVVTARCFKPQGMMSIATKVAIQVNCKIGGIPWTVHNPLSGLMVVGFDVCHDTNRRGTDFGAMVASLDKKLSRFFSAVSAHTTGEELSNYLATNMVKAIAAYREVNGGNIPSHIIVYRDGVGEGQIPFVFDHEVKHVRDAISKLYANPAQVKLGYVLVTKRINTRFFQGKRNPLPGTVVDSVVTNPAKYDFFLISQGVKQGTVSPTSYSVIYDTTGLDADKMQLLAYKMTHIYFNCSTTMRVPAPVQFAHKLAFLVSQSIHTSPTDPHLQKLLYFL
ncbi:protein aubergine [Fopius arisanus]|uniref:Protein aubergine n=2 Tax=Fopius arisanus TaxID=64838 RepID=A0A9R1T1L4_9HYME|nr:PREDICTED: protein aubergine-like [Fopius arisanus]XP_011301416.1 PREDICTED: protein aubergine-like [Fopius arisanus]